MCKNASKYKYCLFDMFLFIDINFKETKNEYKK